MKLAAKFAILLAGLTICLSVFASETISKVTYKWTDSQGVVQYTERPPKDVAYEKITVNTSGGQDVVAVTKDDSIKDSSKKTNTALDDIIASNKRNCKIAQDNLEVLTKLSRIRVKGEDGQERILSPEEKQQKMDETQKQVDIFCDN